MKKIILFSMLGAMALVSCKKDKDEDTNIPTGTEYILINKDTTDNDFIVELYRKSAKIEEGYNQLYVIVKNLNGDKVKNAEVTFEPEMDMGMMQHGSPTIQPEFKNSSNYYEGVVIFTMPTGDMGTWELSIGVNGSHITFPIVVNKTPENTKYVGSYSGTDGKKYILTLVRPFKWQVGMNDFSIMVHRSEMHFFEAIDDFVIEMDPQMTSMGHGSPNNISPSSSGNGFYKGKVNYTMTGDWRLNFDLIKDGDTIVEGAYIDILF